MFPTSWLGSLLTSSSSRRKKARRKLEAELLECRLTPAAMVTTDQPDYAPGSTAVFTAFNDANPGTDFAVGETVQFQVTRTDGVDDYPDGNLPWRVTDGAGGFDPYTDADGVRWYPDTDGVADGRFGTTWYVEPQYAGASLLLTATGHDSGAVAVAEFTDTTNTTTSVNSSQPTTTYGQAVTFTATVRQQGNSNPITSGTVTFSDGAAVLATNVVLDANGQATLLTAALGAGPHTITAQYSGFGTGGSAILASSGTTSQNVNKAPLSITVDSDSSSPAVDAFSRTYGAANPAFAVRYSGFVNNETSAVLTGTLAYTTSATTTSSVGSYTVTAGGQSATNYAITYNPGTLAVTQRALTVSATGVNRVYDGTTAATVSLTANPVNGDALTLAYTTATLADKAVGTGKPVSVSGISVTGTAAGNYTFNTTAAATANITARALAVTATGVNKVYDGGTAATVNLSDNRVSGDVLTAAYTSATFNTKNVGTGKPVSVSGIGITGTDASNYTANTTASATAAITQRALTITAAANTRTYDGTTAAAAVPTYTGLQTGDTLTGLAEVYADKNVGTGKTLSVSAYTLTDGNGGANYAVTTQTSTAGVISAKVLTPAVTANTRGYDGTSTATLSSQTLAGVVSPDAVTLLVTSAAFADKNVGSGKTVTASGLTLGGAAAGNYTLNGVTSATTTANITAAPLSGNFTAFNKPYDASAASSINGRSLAGTVYNADDVTLSGGSATFADANAGPGKTVTGTGFTLAGAAAGNYALTTTTLTTTADITKVGLTVTADAKSKTYDGTAFTAFTASYSGFIAGENSSVVSGVAGFSVSPAGATNAGTYTITPTLNTLSATNYAFTTFTAGTLTIGQQTLTVSAIGVNKVYDGGLTATVTLTDNRVSGDSITVGYTPATFADKNVGTGKTVTVGELSLSGPAADNYTLAATTITTTADITRRALTLTAVANTKTYDGDTTAAATPNVSGLQGTDTVSGLVEAYFTKVAGTGKALLVTAYTVNDGNAGNNYSVSTVNNFAGVINQRALTVSATASNKEYDGTTTATVALSDNRVSGDVLAINHTTADFDTKNVGTGKTVTVAGIAVSGADAGNYTANSSAATTGDITPKAASVTANPAGKTYGDADPVLTGSTSGFVDADGITATFSRDAGEAVGSYTVSATLSPIGSLSNYTITDNTAAFTITTRAVTVTADPQSKVYGTADPTLTYQLTTGTLAFSDAFTGTLTRDGGENVGNYAIRQGTLALNSNYTLTYAGASLSVTKAALSVTADSKTREYGDANPALTGTLTGAVDGDGITASYSTAASATSNVGGYAITPTLNDPNGKLANYTVTSADGTLTVTAATLHIYAPSPTRAYGDSNPDLAGTYAGQKNGETFGVTGSTPADDASPVGGYAVTPDATGATLGNYTLVPHAGILQVTTRAVTVTAHAKAKTYGDGDPSLTYFISAGSLANNDAFTGGLARDPGQDVGSYAITQGSLALSSNYALTYVGASLTIDPATLTVTAEHKTKTYWDADPPLTYQAAGFKYGQTEAILTGGLTRDAGENVGSYAIRRGDLAAPNYTIAFTSNTLDIGKAATVTTVTTMVGGPHTYDANPHGAASSLVAGANLSTTATNFSYSGTAADGTPYGPTATAPTNAGTYTVTAFYAGDDNHEGSTSDPAAITIGKAVSLTVVTIHGSSFTYTGAAQAPATVRVTGVGGLDQTPAAVYANNTNAGTATASYSYAGDANHLGSDNSQTFVIGKANATISVPGYTVTYDGQPHTATGTAKGVQGEDLLGLNLAGTAHANAGTYADTWAFTDITGNYNNTSGMVTDTINKANATINVAGYTGVYDGAAHGATGSAAGVESTPTDLSGLLSLGASFTNAPGGTAHWVFAGNGNYNPADGDVAIVINKAVAAVNVSGYSGTYDAMPHGATGSYTGVGTDTAAAGASLSLGATFTDAPGGTAHWVFTGGTNYTDQSGNVAVAVDQANADISVTPYSVTYDANPHTASGTATGVGGVNLSGLLTLTATTHTNAGTYTGDMWSFAGNTNYKGAAGTVDNTISRANQTITWANPAGITYGTALSAAQLNALVAGVAGGTPIGAVTYIPAAGTVLNAGAGQTLTVCVGGTANYNPATKSVTVDVAKATPTVTWANPAAISYGTALSGTQLNATSSWTVGGLPGGVAGSFAYAPPAGTVLAAGLGQTLATTFTPADTANYNPATKSVTIDVNKATLTVTADSTSRTYGDTNPAFTATITGFVSGDTPAVVGGSPSLATTATPASPVGPYAIAAGLGSLAAANYQFCFANGTLTVDKRGLTVTASDRTKTYGDALALGTTAFTSNAGGLVNGDAVVGVTLTSDGAAATAGAGGYDVLPSAATGSGLSNYDISYAKGTLTVNKALLTVKADDKSRAYGDGNPTFTASYSGFKNGQTLATSGVAGSPALATAADATSPVGGYPITASLGTLAAGNYYFSFVNGTLTVGKATLTVKADNASRQYSDPNPAFTASYSGYVNGDTLASSVTGSPSLTTTATATSPVGSHTITAAVGTLASANYSFAYTNGTLTVSNEDARATYTGLDYVTTASASTSTVIVPLSATVRDITAVTTDAAYDVNAGDIRTATVTFEIYAFGGGLVATVPGAAVTLVNANDPKVGTSTASYTFNIGNSNAETYVVRTVVRGNYANTPVTATDENVTVAKPVAGAITGGGYLVNTSSAGLYAGDAGARTNFGLNVKFNKSGTNLQGQVNVIVRGGGKVYQIKSTAIDSLNLTGGSNLATFVSKANLTDITNPLNPFSLVGSGSGQLTVTLTDNGEPGSADTIGITLRDRSTGQVYFSSKWSGTATAEQVLNGGNLQVRPALEAAAVGVSAGGVTDLTAGQLAPVVAEAKARWQAAGLTPAQQQALARLTVGIDRLPAGELGFQTADTVVVDVDATGAGWFVDPTPADDAEFRAPGDQGEQGRYDLLSVVMHEMGHALGFDHEPVGVMHEDLAVGVRATLRGTPAIQDALVGPGSPIALAGDWLAPATAPVIRFDPPAGPVARPVAVPVPDRPATFGVDPLADADDFHVGLHGAVVDVPLGVRLPELAVRSGVADGLWADPDRG